jgi:hypothetical protein
MGGMTGASLRAFLSIGLLMLMTSRVSAVAFRSEVIDEATGAPLAARVYLQGENGTWHFVESASPDQKAVRYEKVSFVNSRSVEMHTTIPAGMFHADLAPGSYRITVERGKEYFPLERQITVGDAPDAAPLKLPLRRWIDMASRGWYSGDTHLHRELADVPSIMLAEDLNVTFPLTYWVTRAFTSPSSGDKNLRGVIPDKLVELDATHVIWPRNTEYEISTINGQRHMLGGVFVLGHSKALSAAVPSFAEMRAEIQAEGALLDLDKHSWPWAMALPPVLGVHLYELANNHMWRTEFGFKKWTPAAPPHVLPPYGGESGNEREWISYTFGNYYALLNCGFFLRPTAGTANGVHPVPAGFGRVYVHLPDGFSYDAWKRGLDAGRSFVTTGPMLFAQFGGADLGAVIESDGDVVTRPVSGTVVSETPVTFIELIKDGTPVKLLRPQNRKTSSGAFESDFDAPVTFEGSGWLAVRCWEDRPDGRVRYAHTAPWRVTIAGRPQRAPKEDRDHLVKRMRDEIERCRGVFPQAALDEYARGVETYERVPVRDDAADLARTARKPSSDTHLRAWLENMIWHHRFTSGEVRQATGLPLQEIEASQSRFGISEQTRPAMATGAVKVLPYPGGRHPRVGFLDGAVDPERETKVSVFAPWDERSYVVVDVPEAIWHQAGLLYLAHTHVPTVWTKQGINLPRLEWRRLEDGPLESERELPNKVAFGTKVTPGTNCVRMDLWLRNGSSETLTGLRVQNCVMLKACAGFSAQTNQNKRLEEPFVGVRSDDGQRWIITAWTGCHRTWANAPVPCMHSDPKFPDCAPGQTQRLRGWLWFYEGTAPDGELSRLRSVMASP